MSEPQTRRVVVVVGRTRSARFGSVGSSFSNRVGPARSSDRLGRIPATPLVLGRALASFGSILSSLSRSGLRTESHLGFLNRPSLRSGVKVAASWPQLLRMFVEGGPVSSWSAAVVVRRMTAIVVFFFFALDRVVEGVADDLRPPAGVDAASGVRRPALHVVARRRICFSTAPPRASSKKKGDVGPEQRGPRVARDRRRYFSGAAACRLGIIPPPRPPSSSSRTTLVRQAVDPAARTAGRRRLGRRPRPRRARGRQHEARQ